MKDGLAFIMKYKISQVIGSDKIWEQKEYYLYISYLLCKQVYWVLNVYSVLLWYGALCHFPGYSCKHMHKLSI